MPNIESTLHPWDYSVECKNNPNFIKHTIPELNFDWLQFKTNTTVEDNSEVLIVDAVMGAGKTQSAINYINNSPVGAKFLYITPYLDEVSRIKKSCSKFGRTFYEPKLHSETGSVQSKKQDLIKLLTSGKNIVATHALFHLIDKKMLMEIADLSNYILIMDEVADVITPFNISDRDRILIFEQGKLADIDPHTSQVIWKDKDYVGEFSGFKDQVELGTVYSYGAQQENIGSSLYMWTYPVEIFKSFRRNIILTYMFKGQIQSAYYDMYNLKYKYLHVEKTEPTCSVATERPVQDSENDIESSLSQYHFVDAIFDEPQQSWETGKNPYKPNINIIQGKINNIGNDDYSLSKSWYAKYHDKQKDPQLNILTSNTVNFFVNLVSSKSQDNMWTTFKDYKGLVKGKCYTKGFVSANARATNQYINKVSLAYLINRYPNPVIAHFFANRGVQLDTELFALSELLQWIFRSAIRINQPITLYIPSKRMRELLINWLDR